ncbi:MULTISPECIES: hypothetical protein [unclassified Acinetobacter]|uniref:hypothetical protein n=1 Tax=unclassified Acinetobacter TaxID=196816 RepID=UPI000DA6D59A|nr:hypothetical protein [Acinetobacter sp. WCHAc060042]
MSDKLVIALRLPDKKPTDLKFGEMAELFKQFANLLKGSKDNFGYLQEGSIYVGSPPLDAEEYKVAIDQVLQSDGGDLDQYLSKHLDWGNAQIGVHREGESPKQMKILRSIETVITPNKFKQNESLRGRIYKISSGKDSYYLGINFLNGFKVNTKVTQNMVEVLRNYLASERIIEFNGVATYSDSGDFQLYLEDFKVESFEILENDTVDSWVDDFVGYGRSGWQDLDDPYRVLEDERLS